MVFGTVKNSSFVVGTNEREFSEESVLFLFFLKEKV